MDIELTLAAIQQERDAMHRSLGRARAARAAQPKSASKKGSSARRLRRASIAVLDAIAHPLPRRRHA